MALAPLLPDSAGEASSPLTGCPLGRPSIKCRGATGSILAGRRIYPPVFRMAPAAPALCHARYLRCLVRPAGIECGVSRMPPVALLDATCGRVAFNARLPAIQWPAPWDAIPLRFSTGYTDSAGRDAVRRAAMESFRRSVPATGKVNISIISINTICTASCGLL